MSKKTRKLWFIRSNGEEVFLGRVTSKDEAFRMINDFLNEKKYVYFYVRTWYSEDTDRTMFDVGSHTEFFAVEGIM